MLFSKLLIPTLKEAPQEAEIVSHKLMLRAGMIRKVASGIYTWLPLGLKVLKKIENIVREEMDASGARRVKIHPRCKELIKSLRTLTYAPGTGLPNKNLGVDHAFDAFGYLVLQQFNLAKPEAMGTTSYRLY